MVSESVDPNTTAGANSFFSLSVGRSGSGAPVGFEFQRQISAGAYGIPQGDPPVPSQTLVEHFDFYFDNPLDGQSQGSLGGSLRVDGQGGAPPIPEPETYALTLAGLVCWPWHRGGVECESGGVGPSGRNRTCIWRLGGARSIH